MKTLAQGLTQALDSWDAKFGDYRTQENKDDD